VRRTRRRWTTSPGLATGWLPGELSAVGVENARDLGRRRRNDGIDLVVSSDLHRAVRTVEIAFARPRARLGAVDAPFPGGQCYREVAAGVRELLQELLRDHDGPRVLLVGHAATRFALDHLVHGTALEDLVAAPFDWQEGWEYDLTYLGAP
jgi:broad specificity phosphatase PhoE